MANTTWILVANSACARIFVNEGPRKGLTLLKEFDHPQSRQKNHDLITDRAGQAQPGFGRGSEVSHGTKQAELDPKQNEARVFAKELATELYQGRVTNQYKRLIVVAPPAFMGLLNEKLDDPTAQLITDRFEKDYTKSAERDLASHLESCIFL